MQNWIEEIQREKKYLGYYTSEAELILIPRTSTAPIIYGVVENAPAKDIESFQTKTGIKVLPIKYLIWNSESSPVVRD